MADTIYWFGVAHLAIYALAGFSLLTMRLMDGIVKRTAGQSIILQWWYQRLKQRRANRPAEGWEGGR